MADVEKRGEKFRVVDRKGNILKHLDGGGFSSRSAAVQAIEAQKRRNQQRRVKTAGVRG